MKRNSFIEMTKLHNLSERITYISSCAKQEYLYEVYATEPGRAFWRELAKGKRSITFSRYASVGSHRYPVGFSGDTIISWDSLNFQPYFTNTASNIGYGWWSHDIGGHMMGVRDDELMARWVQYGVFSPINRLHSTDNPFIWKGTLEV